MVKVAWMTKPEIIKSYIERDLDEQKYSKNA